GYTSVGLASRTELGSGWQRCSLLVGLLLLGITSATGVLGASVTTRSYDNTRTGWNQNETTLSPSNVSPNTFNKVQELRVDDKIEASPLYVADVNTISGPHDLLIVATTNNTVYAFDAKNETQVWSKSLGNAVEGIKTALYNKWGITSTPVVDPD